MKRIVKSMTAVAAAAALLCASGCSGDTKWSFKTKDHKASSGVWIYYTFTATDEALSKLYESDSAVNIENADFSKEIDGKKATDWIYDQAKKNCRRYLTMEKLAKEYKIKISDETLKDKKSELSTTYDSYNKQLNNIFVDLGVSADSYLEASWKPDYIQEQLFDKIYGKGGTKEVKETAMKKYFTNNYVTFYYVTCSLTKQDATTGTKTDLDDETQTKYKTNFNRYANMLNNGGKTTDDVEAQYKIDFETDTVQANTATNAKADMTDDELSKAILETEVGKAVVKEQNDTLYLIYRTDIDEKAKELFGETGAADFVTKDDVLHKMKDGEFDEFLADEQKKLEMERNDACIHKYDAQRTIDIMKKALKS